MEIKLLLGRVKNISMALAVSYVLLFSSSLIAAPTPLSQNGQLRVSGMQLVNECGTAIQLRGVSSHGLQWYGLSQCMDYCCVTSSGLDYLANTVGIDVFRIACYSAENGYVSNPSGFTAQVNNIVEMCEQKGIYALIDWHNLTDGDPNTNIIYARTFWESMATAHKNRRNVIYEICNEPNGVSWSQIKTYANDIIPRIRAIDNDAVIIVGTPNWSQLGWDVVNDKLSFSNIMYTFHFYAATHDTSMLSNFVGLLPIFVTEWAATEATGAGGTNYTRADQFISIMATNKISWCAWSWSEAPEASGMLNAGACNAGTWSSYKPTGSYVVGKVSNPADNFGSCTIATVTHTPSLPAATETVGPSHLILDDMVDGNYMSRICTDWYTYDDSNDCNNKDCVNNPRGTSLIVPWSDDRFEDSGVPFMPFYMQQPGRGGGSDYAARITGIVRTTFEYGFAGLGFPLKEPQSPVNISSATGLTFWCKSNESRSFRLKINSPAAFNNREDEDMYGFVFTATTSWQKISVDFSSVLFSQEGWGNTLVTKAMALSAVNAIQWQTQGQTGAPYNFDLWVDDVVLLNAPAAQKTIAAIGCLPPALTSTRTPIVTATRTPTLIITSTATRTATGTRTPLSSPTNTAANTSTFTRTVTLTATRTRTVVPTNTNTAAETPTFTRTATPTATRTATPTATRTATPTATRTATPTATPTATRTSTPFPTGTNTSVNTATFTRTVTATSTGTATPTNTVYNSPTLTPTRTFTRTPSFTSTATGTYTATLSHTASPTISQTWTGTPPTSTATPTITQTWTNSPTLTRTPTTTVTQTNTPLDTATFTHTATTIETLIFTATTIPTGMPTNTPTDIPSDTATHTPVNTSTEVETPVSTDTPQPTETQVHTNTEVPTAVITDTPLPTITPSDTNTPVPTAVITDTPLPTNTPENTNTRIPTSTSTPENTFTRTPTRTGTPTLTRTPTIVLTATPTRTPEPQDAEVFEITNMTGYPNPYNPAIGLPMHIRVEFSRKHTNVEGGVYTASLRCIKRIEFPDSLWAGERTLTIPASLLSGLANGSYYFVLTADSDNGAKARSKIQGFSILK